MATALSLALKVSADASAFKLDPVQRALVGLGDQIDKTLGQFNKFASGSTAAGQAQDRFRAQFDALTSSLRDGTIGATQYAAEYERLEKAARRAADTFAEGAAITERNMTAAERFDAAQANLRATLDAGAISEQTFNRENERLARGLTDAERAARGLAPALNAAATQGLRFNELSGIFAALPGPLGNIAGRFSGLASASEGLSRIFAGGLTQGLTSVAASAAALVNPMTLAVAGVAALGAAATSVVSGLASLEGQTEKLRNAADKLGVSFKFIETLQQAAEMSGVSFETVNSAMTKLLKTLAGADEESKQATAALARLGVSLEELNGKNSEEQLRLIAARLTAIEDPAKRAAAATAIFGKSGADILPFVQNLGIADQTLTRFNARLSEIDVNRVLGLGDSFDAVKASLSGVTNELLTPFIGITQSISDGLASAIAAVGRNFGALFDAISPLTSVVGLASNVFLQLGSVVLNLVGAAFEPAAAVGRTLSSVFDTVSQAVTAVAGRINDAIIGFRSFFRFEGLAATFNQTFSGLYDTISRVSTIINVAFSKAGEFVAQLGSRFAQLAAQSPLLQSIGQTVSAVFGSVSQVFETISNAIGGTVGRLLTMAERFLGIETSAKGASGGVEQVAAATEQVLQLGQQSQDALNKAIEQAGQYGQAGFEATLKYQQALRDVEEMIKEEGLTEEQATRARANVTAEYERQIDVVKQASDAKRKAADEAQRAAQREVDAVQSIIDKTLEQIRIEQDFGGDAARARNVADLQRVRDEIAKTEVELAKANAAGDSEAATRAAARLAQLDQVEAKLADVEAKAADKVDQVAQGFADGFDKAFESTTRGINDLIDKAGKFGNEGAKAAQQLQAGIARAQEQVRAGILSKDAYEAEVAAQRKVYEEKLAQLDRLAKAEQASRDAAFQAQVNANQRLDAYMKSLMGERAQQELKAAEDTFKRRKEAAENIKAIEDRIALQQKSVDAARANNDLVAAKARQAELDALKKVKDQEKAIVEGKADANGQIAKASNAAQQAQLQQQQVIASVARSQAQATQNAAQDLVNRTNAALADSANRQRKLLNDLNTLGSRTVQTADVRTQEGAAIVLGLVANAQDPQLIEARIQNKFLRQIANTQVEYLKRVGLPVIIG